MVRINNPSLADIVNVRPEASANHAELVSNHRNLTVSLGRDAPGQLATHIVVSHGGKKDALSIELNRTIRVPDNRDVNSLPPGLGFFPLFKIADYEDKMPQQLLSKGGIFFPMYQREAMWISFSASAPFALKMYVGGVNAVSGLPMTENEKTAEKRKEMLESGKSIQDYLVLPEQPWLDGIASEDGKIRQFVAEPKGNGFSVEAQVTGEEKVGGIQIEIIPIKKHFPAQFDVRYEDKKRNVFTRTFNLAEKGLTPSSSWKDVKERIREEFDIPVEEQALSEYTGEPRIFRSRREPRMMDFGDETQLGDVYFPAKRFTLGVTHPQEVRVLHRGGVKRCLLGGPSTMSLMSAGDSVSYRSAKNAPQTMGVDEMGLAAGGLIKQSIVADPHPADVWDVDASVMLNLAILDVDSFAAVTGQPAPSTPISAQHYARYGMPFFDIWGEEASGIKGDFKAVKSVAQLMAEKAEAEGREYTEEETVQFKVAMTGPFRSTFRPLPILCQDMGYTR